MRFFVFQETLETLHLGEPGSDDTTVRDKRTIGPLRQLFPGLSQVRLKTKQTAKHPPNG